MRFFTNQSIEKYIFNPRPWIFVQYQGFFSALASHCVKSLSCGWFAAFVQVGVGLSWRVSLKEISKTSWEWHC